MSKYILELLGESEHDGFVVMQIRADGGPNNGFIVPEDVAHMLMHLVYPKQPEPRSPIDDMRDGVFRLRQGAKPLDPSRLPQDRERERGRTEPLPAERAQPERPTPRQAGQAGQAGRTEPVAALRRAGHQAPNEDDPNAPSRPSPNSRAGRAQAIGSRGDGDKTDTIFDRRANTISVSEIADNWTQDPAINRDLIEREIAKVGARKALEYVKETTPQDVLEAHILTALSTMVGGKKADVLSVAARANPEGRTVAKINVDTRDVMPGNRAGLILPDPDSYIPLDADDDLFAMPPL